MRVRRRHRRLQVHKPEVRALKHVRHIAEERRPPLFALTCRGRSLPDSLMWDHVSRHRNAHPRQIVRVGSDDGCGVVDGSEGDEEGRSNRQAGA